MQLDVAALGVDLVAMAPPFLLGGVAMGVLLLGLVVKKKEHFAYLAWLSVAGLAISAAATLLSRGGNRAAFGQMLAVDDFYAFFAVLAIVVAALGVVLSASYIERTGMAHPEYYGLMVFGAAGMVIMVAASNLLVLLLGLELLSLSLYILAGFARTRLTSEEAALKYFLLGSFALGLLIYGIALIYGTTQTLDYSGIARAMGSEPSSNPTLLVGLGLVLVGFAFKLSLVPFHMWAPDVYEGAPTPVTAYMAVGTKAVAFAALLRMLTTAFPAVQQEWAWPLAAMAAATMIWGNVAAVVQGNIKRLLAYSAIAHAGYILMAVVAGGSAATGAMVFYLVAYTAMNYGAFSVIVAVAGGREENLSLDDYAGLSRRHPWLAAAMAVFMLSLAGVPPTAGFLAKLYVFSAALQGGYLWLAIVGIATSVVAMYYYLRVVVVMYMSEPAAEAVPSKPAPSMVAVMLVAAFFTLQLGILPGLILIPSELPIFQALP